MLRRYGLQLAGRGRARRKGFTGSRGYFWQGCWQALEARDARSTEAYARALQRDPLEPRGPALASLHGQRARQRPRRDDLSRRERWIIGIARQQTHRVADRRQRPLEHVQSMALVHRSPVAEELDLEACERPQPFVLLRADFVARADQQRAMQPVCGDTVRGREFAAGVNRLHGSKPCATQATHERSAASSMPRSEE